jgi:hypothetical protein
MAINIPGVSVIGTKQASGNVQLVFQNPNGGIRYAVVIPAADFTSFNTTVNGGSTGATLTKTYGQDANNTDYPFEYVGS